MPLRTVAIPTPMSGWHTESAASEQPAGTSPSLLNVVPVDALDGDRARLSRRTGMSLFSSRAVESGSPIRSAAGSEVTSRAGNFVVGSAQVQDVFTESDTSNGDLADRFNNATLASGADSTDDYYIFVGSANTKDSFINAPWSTGRGPAIISNRVVDTISPQTSDHTGARELWAAVSRLALNTTTSFVLELTAKTLANISGKQGNVGFILFADETTLNGSATDDSTLLFIERIGTGDSSIDCNPYRNNTTTQFDILLEQHEETDEILMSWEADTIYTFRLYVDGEYGELWIKKGTGQFAFKQRWPSLRRWYKTSTPGAEVETVAAVGNDVGFLVSNVGYDGLFEYVDNFTVYSMEQRSFSVESVLVAACGNDIWIGDESDGFIVANGGNNVLTDAPDICMVPGPSTTDGEAPTVYVLDGQEAYKVDLETSAASDWAAGATDFPLDDNSLPPRYLVNYNGSACVFGFQSKPGYVVLSRKDDWDDFDITPTAANLNGKQALPMAHESPVTACIPFRGEAMIVSAMNRSWMLDGDPRLGGRRLILSESVGCVGAFAQCTDDRSMPYWVSLDGFQGLSDAGPELISGGRIDRFFRAIDHTASIVRLGWSADHGGIFIMIQNRDEQYPRDGVFWHKRSNTFWPLRYPEAMGPTCIATLARPLASSRPVLLFGGWDGSLRVLDRSTKTDDGQKIIAYADIGPIAVGGMDEAVLHETRILTGRTTESMYVEMRSAEDAELLLDAEAMTRRHFTGAGVLAPIDDRIGAEAISIRVGTDEDHGGHFAIERIEARVEQSRESAGRLSA